jgi:putative tryptophan/tyrosine transport system substrate-binding protein
MSADEEGANKHLVSQGPNVVEQGDVLFLASRQRATEIRMKRREFIFSTCAVAVWPRASSSQPTAKIPSIGYLAIAPVGRSGVPDSSYEAFRRGLQELGHVEGQNLVIHDRIAHGQVELLPSLATELVQLNVDVLVAGATPGARAASQATKTIPIIAPAMGDPVADGLVASLARPGGNITGSTFLGPELVPKRMELLRETLPKATHVAVLWHPNAFGDRTMREMLDETRAAARTQRLELQFVEVRDASELDHAFSAINYRDGLLVSPSVTLFMERKHIADQAMKHGLPLFTNAREFTKLGGLMSYGANIDDLVRRAAIYADKILKGAQPSDLPVEQPTKFELIVNLKTAKALDLTVPPALLARADEVIE